jgi:hypothetical protein
VRVPVVGRQAEVEGGLLGPVAGVPEPDLAAEVVGRERAAVRMEGEADQIRPGRLELSHLPSGLVEDVEPAVPVADREPGPVRAAGEGDVVVVPVRRR